MPRVSVGVPVFNGESYLAHALESLLDQSFADLEVLISDNASTDRTSEICQEYARRDDRISYQRNARNLGAVPNYNRLVDRANGEYFKWASHDDICAPTLLEHCVAELDSDPKTVLCYASTVLIDSEGKTIAHHRDGLHLVSDLPQQRLGLLLRKPPGCNAVFGLIRSEALAATRLFGSFESSDNVLLAELCLRGRFREVPLPLFYRRHHSSMSRRAVGSRREMALWYDTSYKGKNRFPYPRVLIELLKAIYLAPLSGRQKALCMLQIPRGLPDLIPQLTRWLREMH